MNRDRKPPIRLFLFHTFPILALLILGIATPTRADPLEDAARQLARKISEALAPQEAVGFSVRNLSSLPAREVAAVTRALEAELQARGVLISGGPAGRREVRITLAENLAGYLWIAESPRGDTPRVTMLAVPRPSVSSNSSRMAGMVLRSQFLWEQPQPILDLIIQRLGSDVEETMVVLEPLRLALYKQRNAAWMLDRGYPFAPNAPVTRDAAGVLGITPRSIAFQLNAGSYRCDLALSPGAELRCESRMVMWPPRPEQTVEFLGKKTSAWFSAASVKAEGHPASILAGLDGLARLYVDDGGPDAVATFSGWGSNLASLASRCGSGSQVLVTGVGDYTVPDTVRAYEIEDWQAVAVTPPAEFPGPVLALLTAPDGNTALVVIRNLKTGNYEAYRLSLFCPR